MSRFRLRAMVAGAGAAVMAIGGVAWLAGAAAAAPAAGTVVAAHAKGNRGDHSGRRVILGAALAPSLPTDPDIFGVAPGAKPWVIKSGHVRLSADGMLKASVKGLVIPPADKNPLPQIAAVVFCDGSEVATAGPVPFTAKGNAHLAKKVTLPAFCAAPAVILEPAHAGMLDNMYIAFDGK